MLQTSNYYCYDLQHSCQECSVALVNIFTGFFFNPFLLACFWGASSTGCVCGVSCVCYWNSFLLRGLKEVFFLLEIYFFFFFKHKPGCLMITIFELPLPVSFFLPPHFLKENKFLILVIFDHFTPFRLLNSTHSFLN